MDILFLSHYFPPEINAPARVRSSTAGMGACRAMVTVVTCAPTIHARPATRGTARLPAWREGIEVIRLWTWLSANEGFLLRTLNYVSYMVACILALPWLPRADVVVSTSPQFFNGLAGYFVSRFKRCPWLLEIRDLWPESILAVGAIKNRHVIAFLRWSSVSLTRRPGTSCR